MNSSKRPGVGTPRRDNAGAILASSRGPNVTEASLQMLSNLRSTENLQWYVVPLIVLIVYIYNTEVERKNWGVVLLSIYFFATSGVVLEIVNALVLHFTRYSALWTTPGQSAFVIYAGWNVEILFLARASG